MKDEQSDPKRREEETRMTFAMIESMIPNGRQFLESVNELASQNDEKDKRIAELEAKVKEQEHLIDVLNMEIDDMINSMNS